MTTEDIIEFLRTGELTNFPLGTAPEKVIAMLGDNIGWTVPISRKDKRLGLIKYDRTEFYFNNQDNQKLFGVQVTYSQPADKKGLEMDYSELINELSYEQIKAFLARNKISFEETISEYDKETRVIKTQGQVIFSFSDDNRLEKFGRFVKE